MASEIIVNTIKAPTTGANANKVIIPSGVTLDASAGTLKPSAGQIIKQESKVIETQVSSSSSTPTSLVSSGFFMNYTPIDATSLILVELFYHYYKSGSSTGGGLQLRKDGANMSDLAPTSTSGTWHTYDANAQTTGHSQVNMAQEIAGNTNQRQYQCYISNYSGSTGTFYVGYNTSTSNMARTFMRVTEIAQ